MSLIELTIDGKPTGKGRVRHNGRIHWQDSKTKLAESQVIAAWQAAGRQRVEGPLAISVLLMVPRPTGHFRRDGQLNAEGLRHPLPHRKKPDLDNALKLIMDSMNGRAYRDDVQVVQASVRRAWAPLPLTHVVIEEIDTLNKEQAA